jgi:hypothetical protein
VARAAGWSQTPPGTNGNVFSISKRQLVIAFCDDLYFVDRFEKTSERFRRRCIPWLGQQ